MISECSNGHICFGKEDLSSCTMRDCGRSTVIISPINIKWFCKITGSKFIKLFLLIISNSSIFYKYQDDDVYKIDNYINYINYIPFYIQNRIIHFLVKRYFDFCLLFLHSLSNMMTFWRVLDFHYRHYGPSACQLKRQATTVERMPIMSPTFMMFVLIKGFIY